MFKNLEVEIIKSGMNYKEFARKIGMSVITFRKKMSGKADFRLDDARKIVSALNSGLTVDYLFCED